VAHAGEPGVRDGEEAGDARHRQGRQRQPGRRDAKDDPVTGDEGETHYRHDPARCRERVERSGRVRLLLVPVVVAKARRRRDRELQVADPY
jgi:hypothetical protein